MDGDHARCLDSVVRGHHVYKRLWTPFIGEQLDVVREDENEHDSRAVADLAAMIARTALRISLHVRNIFGGGRGA